MESQFFLVITVILLAVISSIIIILTLNKIKQLKKQFQESELKLSVKQKLAAQIGINQTKGDYAQILGDFSFLSKYDQLITLSTTSRQPSLDLIGINDESLDFLEIKKKGATISKSESHVRRLVEEKKVSYKVFDIELPENFSMTERKLKELKK
jgi:predicted Holliday junction resolvase-like endonuclease